MRRRRVDALVRADARTTKGARPPLGDLRARLDCLPRARGAAAAALHALPVAGGLRADRDAHRPVRRADGTRRAGDEERFLPLLLLLGRTGGPAARRPD